MNMFEPILSLSFTRTIAPGAISTFRPPKPRICARRASSGPLSDSFAYLVSASNSALSMLSETLMLLILLYRVMRRIISRVIVR